MKRNKRKPVAVESEGARDYSQLVRQIKIQNPDWPVNGVSVEADLYRNAPDLLEFSRSLSRENPLVIAYRGEVKTNVFGPQGIRCRMQIKETEDRVIGSDEEKAFLRARDQRYDRVNAWLKSKGRQPIIQERVFEEKRGGKMTIKAGQPDVFANQYFERAFLDWQSKEHCTVSGRLTYRQSRHQRMWACIRDGEHFIRLIRNTQKGWKYGFKIQHINAEWCDRGLCIPESKGWEDEKGAKHGVGNPIRYGIEYDKDTGLEPVAFWFIKADPALWSSRNPTGIAQHGKKAHIRYPANEIIHYAMFEDDAEITRPAPWLTPVMNTARQGAKWMEAAVVSARSGACATLVFEADLDGPDGVAVADTVIKELNERALKLVPGGSLAIPPGVRAKVLQPAYPNQNVSDFRNENVREFCSGLPGASAPVISGNFAQINFSAGKLERLSITGGWQMLQEFDIETAERIIFREWQKMALTVQAVKLPLAKFEKFNKAHFQGRRWSGVDVVKEGNAAAAAVENKFTTRTAVIESGICGEAGDFEETVFKLAEEEMILESLGMSTATTAATGSQQPADDEDEEEDPKTKKPEAA